MLAVYRIIEKVAPTDSTVLLRGESGTGKDLAAQALHEKSRRSRNKLISINCAALPENLLESELFGHAKGAFTGAVSEKKGLFEEANGGTLFLDEIGDLSPQLQAKLLRLLQQGEFFRIGETTPRKSDVRIIAATNQNLEKLIEETKFREDLYYRLNVFPIVLPPLRERPEDIPALVWHILNEFGKRMGRKIEGVQSSTMKEFQRYSWPGNVRELRNVIERNLILNTGPVFKAELPTSESKASEQSRRLEEVEADYLRNVLQSTKWRVRGKGGAAEIVGLKPTTLESKLKKLSIRRPD
jgi:transcriptional regulator with PAS, ATPase and Fis domain